MIRAVARELKKDVLSVKYKSAINKDCDTMPVDEALKIINSIRPNGFRKREIVNQPVNPDIDVSIIVPCYNGEKYLEECLNSLISQRGGYRKEIIIVNDGSTDSSEDILAKYESNPEVVVYNQKNAGVSAARNTGLNHAHGKYIMFSDCDDLYSEDALRTLIELEEKTNADICCGGIEVFPEGKLFLLKDGVIKKNDIAAKCELKGSICYKLYKKFIFDTVRFPEGLLLEDTISNMLVNELAGDMATTSKVVYHYRANPVSVSHTMQTTPKVLDAYWAFIETMKMRDEHGIEMSEDMFNFLMYQVGPFTYWTISLHNENVQKAVFTLCRAAIEKYFNWGYKINENKKKLVYQAFVKNNFYAWRIACDLYNRI